MPDKSDSSEQQFINYFMQHLIPGDDKEELALNNILSLLNSNMIALLKKMQISYVSPDTQKITNQDFFWHLEKVMQNALDEKLKELKRGSNLPPIKLEVFIGGGVVRTLLGKIYEDLYNKLSVLQDYEKDVTVVLEKYILYTSQGLLAEEKITANGQDFYVLKDDNLQQLQLTVRQNALMHQIHNFIQQNDQRGNIGTDDSLVVDFIKKHMLSFYKKILQSSEFQLTMMHHNLEPILALFVLGVGSDLDIYYKLSAPTENQWVQYGCWLEQAIKRAGEDFINSAANKYQLQNCNASLLHSIMPVADINNMNKQIDRTVQQGGSLLDMLAFKLDSFALERSKLPSHTHKGANQKNTDFLAGTFFVEPEQHPGIIMDFLQGFYQYIADKVSEQVDVRTIRGLRPLLEIPFLRIKNPAPLIKNLQLLLFQNRSSISDKADCQVDKLQRNARLSGGNNKLYHAEPDSVMFLSKKLIKGWGMNINEFIENLPVGRQQTGKNIEILNNYLIKKSDFIVRHTNNGVLYHGTKKLENILPILRGGFIKSTGNEGTTAVFGSGLYTTPDYAVAKSYGGIIFSLSVINDPRLRIIDVSAIPPNVMEIFNREAISNGNIGVENLFKLQYGVDVIINEYVLIQNSNVMSPMQDMREFILNLIEATHDKNHLVGLIDFYQGCFSDNASIAKLLQAMLSKIADYDWREDNDLEVLKQTIVLSQEISDSSEFNVQLSTAILNKLDFSYKLRLKQWIDFYQDVFQDNSAVNKKLFSIVLSELREQHFDDIDDVHRLSKLIKIYPNIFLNKEYNAQFADGILGKISQQPILIIDDVDILAGLSLLYKSIFTDKEQQEKLAQAILQQISSNNVFDYATCILLENLIDLYKNICLESYNSYKLTTVIKQKIESLNPMVRHWIEKKLIDLIEQLDGAEKSSTTEESGGLTEGSFSSQGYLVDNLDSPTSNSPLVFNDVNPRMRSSPIDMYNSNHAASNNVVPMLDKYFNSSRDSYMNDEGYSSDNSCYSSKSAAFSPASSDYFE
jgi:hypothetical protein